MTAPYLYDITGYLAIEEWPDPDPTQAARQVTVGCTSSQSNKFIAGERVGGRLGTVVEQDDLSIARMIERIYGAVSPNERKVNQMADIPWDELMERGRRQ